MKRQQRIPYLSLGYADLPDGGMAILCCFCRYVEWSGSCEEADCEYNHALLQVAEDEYQNAIQGGDCWGFRPRFKIEVAADIVGIWLQGKGVDWETLPPHKRNKT